MRRRALLLFAALATLAAVAAAEAPDPKTLLKVTARLQPNASVQGTLAVRCELANGWHVNSHAPSEDYLIPTAARLAPADGVSFGEARYPDGVLRKLYYQNALKLALRTNLPR